MVKEGDKITLYVSKGLSEKMVLMPNLLGSSLQQAKITLSQNDLLEGDSITEIFSEKDKGTVIEQSVPANTQVKAHTKINLTVSKGPELKTRSVNITIPQEKETTTIKVVQDGVTIYEKIHNKSDKPFDLPVSGIDSVVVEVYHDGNLVRRMTVPL